MRNLKFFSLGVEMNRNWFIKVTTVINIKALLPTETS